MPRGASAWLDVAIDAGIQREISTDWFLGATGGFTQSWLNDLEGYSTTDGSAGDVAIFLKRQLGPWLLAASGHLGYGSYETERTLGLGMDVTTSAGTAHVFTAAGRSGRAMSSLSPIGT